MVDDKAADCASSSDVAGVIPPNRLFVPFCILLAIGWALALVYYQSLLYLYTFAAVCIIWGVYRLPITASKENLSSFFIYERRMPRNEFVTTLVTTNIGFFSSVAFSTYLIAAMGPGPALIAVIAWIAGIAFFASQVRKLIPFFKTGTTIHEFIALSFGRTKSEIRRLAIYSSVITFLLYIASVGVEIKYASDVFSSMSGVPSISLAWLLSISGIFYVALAGYRGVVSTDRVRFFVIFAGVLAILIFLYMYSAVEPVKWPDGYWSLRSMTVGNDVSTLVSLLILLFLYQFCIMDMWERCIAIVNSSAEPGEIDTEVALKPDGDVAASIWRMLVLHSLGPFLLLFVTWYGIGLMSVAQGWTDDPSQIIPKLFEKMDSFSELAPLLGPFLKSAVIICFLSAALSTIDGFLIAAVQTVVFDWWGKRPQTDASEASAAGRHTLLASRGLIIICGIGALTIAYAQFDLLNFWVGMYALMLSFFPPIWQSLNHRGGQISTPGAVAAAIIFGSGFSLVISLLGTFVLTESRLATLAAPVAVGASWLILKIGPKREGRVL
jgi:Na+/proline symporter